MSNGLTPADTFARVMKVVALVSQGRTKSVACDEAGIAPSTLDKYIEATPELYDVWKDAEQRGFDRMADALVNIDSDLVYGTTDPKKMKILSDNIKWFLSRKRPDQYGERVQVEHKLSADRVIIDALERARQRALGNVVDAEYTVLPSPAEAGDDEDFSQFI